MLPELHRFLHLTQFVAYQLIIVRLRLVGAGDYYDGDDEKYEALSEAQVQALLKSFERGGNYVMRTKRIATSLRTSVCD